MSGGIWTDPDMHVTERERYHAAIAYTRPVGNTDPDNDPVGQAFLMVGDATNSTGYHLPATTGHLVPIECIGWASRACACCAAGGRWTSAGGRSAASGAGTKTSHDGRTAATACRANRLPCPTRRQRRNIDESTNLRIYGLIAHT